MTKPKQRDRSQPTEDGEEWRPVTLSGYGDFYQVSNQGRVWSNRSCLVMSPSKHRRGHLRVHFKVDGAAAEVQVHQLVMWAFVGPTPEGQLIRHLDDVPGNNLVANLAFGTHAENKADAVRNGIHPESRKTHCPQKHPYDTINTQWYKGARRCRACNRDRTAEYRRLIGGKSG